MGLYNKRKPLSVLFRGMLPVVIDIETSGLNPITDAILEIAAVTLKMNGDKKFSPDKTFSFHVEPFVGANLDKSSLEITKIDPTYPLRYAITEQQALHNIFSEIKKMFGCASMPKSNYGRAQCLV